MEEPAGERMAFYFLAVLYLSLKMLSSVTSSAKPSWAIGGWGTPVHLGENTYHTTCNAEFIWPFHHLPVSSLRVGTMILIL